MGPAGAGRVSLANIGLDATQVAAWFSIESTDPFTLARMSPDDAKQLANRIATALRRCYVADAALVTRYLETGRPIIELIAAKLPDAGSTMAGDFGEILVYAYLAASRYPTDVGGPLKWRLKQDRTKPAPHTDVILYHLPSWPTPSDRDVLISAEVKTKSTDGRSTPIPDAIRDSGKDRISRLARTLQWLRERALHENVDGVDLAILDRFGHASDHPAAIREFAAVAVLCDSLVDDELASVPTTIATEQQLVVLVIPDLHTTYTSVFAAAASAEPAVNAPGDA